MVSIKIIVTKVTDDSFPGWVEGELIDAFGKCHTFNDKSPVFEKDADSRFAKLPRKGAIRCTIVEEKPDLVIIETELPDHVESNAGETCFSVLPSQIARD